MARLDAPVAKQDRRIADDVGIELTLGIHPVEHARVGRVRDLVVGPDGAIYLAFNTPDRIARMDDGRVMRIEENGQFATNGK